MKPPQYLCFGDFRYDLAADRLSSLDGEVVVLQPRPQALLRLLLQHPNQLLSREFIRERLWSGQVVEFDQSLNFCVRQLRKALGDSAEAPRYVETVPKRGLRWVCDVSVERPQLSWFTGRYAWAAGLLLATVLSMVAVFWLPVRGLDPAVADGTQVAPEAREAYLRGQFLMDKGTEDAVQRSVALFERAVAIEPEYVDALMSMARAHYFLGQSSGQGYDRVRYLLAQVLALEPNNVDAHVIQGLLALNQDWDFLAAEEAFEKVLVLDSNQRTALHVLPLVKAARGDMDQALHLIGRYLVVDPARAQTVAHAGWFYYLDGDYVNALGQCEAAVEIDPAWRMGLECAANAARELNRSALAHQYFGQYLRTYSDTFDAPAVDQENWMKAGYQALLDWLLQNQPEHHFEIARVAARTGDQSLALRQLELSINAHQPMLPMVEIFPEFRQVRESEGFASLMQSAGLLGVEKH
ncbi:MAG: hypothetical protein DHS20C11_11150 [Lysobacteraceae bacterium]|nr:MAG: hypothetical protein DHS20C11_11150 [Xanthomonadaceae bacterium]